MEAIKDGSKHFDFVEVMACPGGCINGDGQIYVDYNKVSVDEVIKKRGAALYKADGDCKFTGTEENESVKIVYEEILKNNDKLIHKLLHYVRDGKNFY